METKSHRVVETQSVDSCAVERKFDLKNIDVWNLSPTAQEQKLFVAFSKARDNVSNSAQRIRYFYEALRLRVGLLEDVILYPPRLRIPPGTNLVAGEIWFATYALAEHCRVDCSRKLTLQSLEVSTHFSAAVLTVCQISDQLKVIKRIQVKLEKEFHSVVQSIVDIVYDNDVGLKFAISKATIVAGSHQQSTQDGLEVEPDFGQADTLANRHNRDIFLRNISSNGWTNFRKLPEFERKTVIIDIVVVAQSRCRRLLKQTKKFKKMLVRSKYFSCDEELVLLKYMKNWRSNISKLKKYSHFTSRDRLDLYSAVLDMRQSFASLFQTVQILIEDILELCDVTYLASNYLSTEYNFHVQNYTHLKKYSVEYRQQTQNPNTDLYLPTNDDDYDDDELDEVQTSRRKTSQTTRENQAFYAKYYPVIHRRNAVTIADLQLILLSKISTAVKHSMANFDGPRFLQLDQLQHIWLANTRQSISEGKPDPLHL